ncbi:hypothetical protein KY284_033201 [Solanum tuberosum]|nr:hypothetical protein KY284_033201 [Solanum tuberosum]
MQIKNIELNEVLPITYEDKKNIQSDEETTGQSHSNNRLITSDVDEENKLRNKGQKQRGKTAPAYTDQRTNIHDEEQHGKKEENINTDLSVSKSVCTEDRNQE